MLSFDAVTLQYRPLFGPPRTVVQNLTWRIEPGSVHALVGHNGAGKTTLVRAALGLLRPSSGTVTVLGLSPHRERLAVQRRAGVLLDGQRVFPQRWTGLECLIYTGLQHGLCWGESRSRARNLLERLGLATAATQRVNRYSRGMRQRLSLAATLMNEPQILIWDEPTLGLDMEGGALVRNLLTEARQAGMAVLLTSHEPGLLEQAADAITVLDRGGIVAQGDPGEIAALTGVPRLRFLLDRPAESLTLPADVAVSGHELICPVVRSTLRAVLAALDAADCELRDVREVSSLEQSLLKLQREVAP